MKLDKIQTKEDLTEIFKTYHELIYKFVYFRVAKKKEIAEDISQDVFLKVWRRREAFDGSKSAIKTWLFTIARNTVIDYYRTRKDKSSETFENISGTEDLGKDIETEDLSNFVIDKMKYLEDSDRELLILRYVEQLDLKEISEIMGKSYDAVKVAVHRAVKKLKTIINQQ